MAQAQVRAPLEGPTTFVALPLGRPHPDDGRASTGNEGTDMVFSIRRCVVGVALVVAIALVPDALAARDLGASPAPARGGKTESIKVSKCYTNATISSGGEMLIKASSSDPSAHLSAYRPDGTLIGPVQNSGGSRYGGTVMPWQPYDPVDVTVRSSSGASVTVPTTPFQG
jgi:hypothetical protein